MRLGKYAYSQMLKSKKELENAILRICDLDKIIKMGNNSRKLVEKKFDVNIINTKIINNINL